jgi:hypothetical protein
MKTIRNEIITVKQQKINHTIGQVTLPKRVVTIHTTLFNSEGLCILPTHFLYLFHMNLYIKIVSLNHIHRLVMQESRIFTG